MDGTSPFVAAVKMCGGVDKIEDLQRRESHKIYDMAVKILEILENRFEIDLACTCVDARGRGRFRCVLPSDTQNAGRAGPAFCHATVGG